MTPLSVFARRGLDAVGAGAGAGTGTLRVGVGEFAWGRFVVDDLDYVWGVMRRSCSVERDR